MQTEAGKRFKGAVFIRVFDGGPEIYLLPQKAAYIPIWNALLVADVHLAKSATFIKAGIPVPPNDLPDDLQKLSALIHLTNCAEVIFLGDFFHHHSGLGMAEMDQISIWREVHESVKMTLITGNHDRNTQQMQARLRFVQADEMERDGLLLTHMPTVTTNLYNLAGHVHPKVLLRGKARQHRRLSCFFFGEKGGILPAFGTFTGGALLNPKAPGRFYVAAGEKVLALNSST